MGLPTKENVNFGLAAVYVAGTASPITLNTVSWASDGWVRLGFQQGGVVMSYTPTFHEQLADEATAPLDMLLMSEEVKITVTLLESDLDQVQHAITDSVYTEGAIQGTNPNTLEIGKVVGCTPVIPIGVGFESCGRDGLPFIGFFPRCVAIGAVEPAFVKDGDRLINFEFKVLTDTSQSANQQLGVFTELTAA